MLVRATQLGYYGDKRRRVDDVFELVPRKLQKKDEKTGQVKVVELTPEDQFSDVWMEKVHSDSPSEKPTVATKGRKATDRNVI